MDTFEEPLKSYYPYLKISISEDLSDPDWDSFLATTSGSSHLQTSLWAKVKESVGWRCLRIIVKKNDAILTGVQILIRNTRLGSIGYASKGPVVPHDNDHYLINLINKKVLEIAQKMHIRALLVQPPNNGHVIGKDLVSFGFKISDVFLAPVASAFIDLGNEPDVILAGMRKRTRYNLRLGERQGIIVREGSEKDLEIFYDLYCNTVKRHGGEPESYSYLCHMWRTLSPNGHIKLFLSELDGKTLAGNLLVAFNDTVIFKRTGWSGECKLCPNELLHWSAMKWAKSQGYSYYEFEGIDRRAVDAILSGQKVPDFLNNTPTSFKLGFGCKVIVYPDTYMYILNPFLRWIYNSLITRLSNRSQLWKIAKSVRGS